MPLSGRETSQAFLRSALDAIVGIDHEGNVIEFSSAAERIFGYSRQDALAKPVAELIIPPSLRERHRRALSRHLETGARSILGKRQEMSAIRSDGTEFPIELTVTRLEPSDPPQFMAFIRDISERKRSEAALAASQERYRDLFDNAPDLFVSVDARSAKIIECNQTVARVLGYPREELLGREVFDVYHPDSRDDAKRAFRAFVETGAVRGAELQLQRKDGSRVEVVLNASAIRDEQGRVVSSRSVWRDVSAQRRAEEERRRLEEKMEQAQRLEGLGLLVGGIAHDFNNLLAVILGNSRLALDEVAPNSPIHQMLTTARSAAKQAAGLTQQMLFYAGKGSATREAVNLSQLVESILDLLHATLEGKGTLETDLAMDLRLIAGDPIQLRQVVLNLVTNACEALERSGGRVAVRTGEVKVGPEYILDAMGSEELPAGRYAYVEVADTGVGIDGETQARIFDPFFTTKFSGRGLGLAALLGIVRGHGGAIKVESERGAGATFRVVLPYAPAIEARAAPPTDGPSHPPGKARVLVVDDDEDILELTGAYLEKSGFGVVLAQGGRAALDVFSARGEEIGVVLLDWSMADMGGEETLLELRRVRASIPVLLMSGFSEEKVVSRLARGEVAGFIQKPFEREDLAASVRAVLETQRPDRAVD